MITTDNFPAVLSALAWPIMVFSIFLFLRSEIRALLKRLQNARLPGGTEATFTYGEASVDRLSKSPAQVKDQLSKVRVKWERTGNLFWASHDLMWTRDIALRGGPKDKIVHGLRQFLRHVRALEFINSSIEARLYELLTEVEKSDEQDWTVTKRDLFAKDLEHFKWEIGAFAIAHQPDYHSTRGHDDADP
jgi:hypothetical protein